MYGVITEEIGSKFKRLSIAEREKCFGVSCFSPGELEDCDASLGFTYTQMENRARDILDLLNIELRCKFDTFFFNYLSQGYLSNVLLKYHIENSMDRYRCEFEYKDNDESFDVEVWEDETIPRCCIGLKRCASSNGIKNYLKYYIDKIDNTPADSYLILNLFPISHNENAERVSDFIDGYGYMSEELHPVYKKDEVYVANIPVLTTVEKESDYYALDNVIEILRSIL